MKNLWQYSIHIRLVPYLKDLSYGCFEGKPRKEGEYEIKIAANKHRLMATFLATLIHELLHFIVHLMRKAGQRITDKQEHAFIYAAEGRIYKSMRLLIKEGKNA